MALTTYADLRQALIDWPDLYGEQDMDYYSDMLITLGEARINTRLRLKRSLKTETILGIGLTQSPLPEDFLEVDQVQTSEGDPLEYITVDQLAQVRELTEKCYYSIDGQNLVFSGPVDGYIIRYYPLLAPLIDTDTNWIYKLSPGLYLYSALIDAAVFNKESEQENMRYQTMFESAAVALEELDWHYGLPKSQPITTRLGV